MGLRTLGAAVLVGSVVVSAVVAPSAPAAVHRIDTSDRAAVVAAYQQRLEPLLSVPVEWTGSFDGCVAGSTSERNRSAQLEAVNYMRAMAGLSPVTLNRGYSRKAQAAALIMGANQYLTHYPPKSARCWSKAGYDGASHGNLFLGWSSMSTLSPATGPRAVVGYMEDPGANNHAAGHRRWLMYPRLAQIGVGDTDSSNSVYVVGKFKASAPKAWVPWPTSGFFPRQLEPAGRWSLSYAGASFAAAKVKVTTPDGLVAVKKRPVRSGIGDSTLVWDWVLPKGYEADPGKDYPVTVTVSGIRVGGRVVSRSWTTTLVWASASTPEVPEADLPVDDSPEEELEDSSSEEWTADEVVNEG